MTDQLTGYEASSVEEVGAVLDDSPADAEEVYLRTIGHSERAIAAVAAKRAGSGGGGSTPIAPNFCTISVSDVGPLTLSNSPRAYTADEMTIVHQSGSDFSLGTDSGTGSGAILTAAGGVFQAGAYIQASFPSTLDGSSTAQRWLAFGCQLGGADDALSTDLQNLGLDLYVPIPAEAPSFGVAACGASLPGIAQPGEAAAFSLFVGLRGGVGTDSTPLSGISGFAFFSVWQIGTL